ncbi:tyrosine-protein kinase family protein [Tranquillimonas rosea]|uniref:tyrosine-protein kinase family protein n=1 Tax=Tranquillimonas rosea TaxID=641238 RepID=UPI003BAB0209
MTSPSPGCGKSTVALNLAVCIARQPERHVLTVEADMRRPSHEQLLSLPRGTRSIATLFEGNCALVETAVRPRDNMAMAMSSRGTNNASDILLSGTVAPCRDRIESEYAPEVTLFDMPPLMVNDDT